MSDDYLPMLLAQMQQAMVDLRVRVEQLEEAVAEMTPEAQYLDGSQ